MTSEKYPLLFSPLKVGTQEVRNRVFKDAMAAASTLAREL